MLQFILIAIVCSLAVYVYRIDKKLRKEIEKVHVIQGFVAGLVRSISDYLGTDAHPTYEMPNKPTEFPIPFELLLENISRELRKDQNAYYYDKWINSEEIRLMFDDDIHPGDGFTHLFYVLHRKLYREWHSLDNKDNKE